MTTERGHIAQVVQRWMPSAAILTGAILVLAPAELNTAAVVVAVVLLMLAWFVSPWFFPRSQDDATARQRADVTGAPLIYWRPGCTYCIRLRLSLGRLGNRAIWVDVSQDLAASDRVRDVNGGDETVPTVFVGSTTRVNPRPHWVRERLRPE